MPAEPTMEQVVERMTRAIAETDGFRRWWHEYEPHTRAALAAAEALGFKLVGREPSKEMERAAGDYADRCAIGNYGGCADSSGTWETMWEAAPAVQQTREGA